LPYEHDSDTQYYKPAPNWGYPAGDGAAAALNILTKEKGEHFHDFDVPADAE
jgi:hypothetical protein